MKDQLDAIINAYLTPDPKIALTKSLETVEDIDGLVDAIKDESKALLARETELTEKETARLETCTEILLALHDRKQQEASQQKKDLEKQQQESREKIVADTKQKLAELENPPTEDTVTNTAEEKTDGTDELPSAVTSPPGEQVAAPSEEKELVAAGAGGSAFSAIASLPSGPLPQAQYKGDLTATFATTSSGVVTDKPITDMRDIADSMMAQLRSYPMAMPGNDVKNYIAAYRRKELDEFMVHNRDSDAEVIDAVVAKGPQWNRAKGQFAAGWCAPSETLYELCPYVTSLDGIVDLPEVLVTRGGVRTTAGPDFSTIYNNASIGQILTEAQVIAGTVKTCIEVDCPPFVETRLDVNPLCITGNLLTQAGYPEYVERFIREAVAANAHKINLEILTRMVTASTAVTLPGATGPVDTSSASWFLDAASLYATWLREQYRMNMNATIDVVAPHWYLQQQTADLARRNGVDLLTSEARLRAAFAERNIRIQWVYDWQPMAATTAGAADRPLTVQILVFIPGTFVKLTSPVINLGTIHSAAQLATNQYTAMFAEDGFNVLERCFQSLVVTVPTCPSGTTGANDGICDITP